MRRRFGRRRQGGGGDEGRSALDVPRALERIEAAGTLGVRGLTALDVPGLPAGFAAVGSGELEDGQQVLVAYAPRDAGDAVLAAIAAGDTGDEPFTGTVFALAPAWSLLARRRLALLGETPFALRAVEAPELGDGSESVQPEPLDDAPSLSRQQLVGHLSQAADRALAERAIEGLGGLAAKHGGTLRIHGRSVELVLLSRRVAAVRVDDDGVLLDTIQPQRRSERLSPDDLGDALDRLEGGLRKRLHDREVRDGEEGLRARAIPALASLLSLRAVTPWPRGGADAEAVDLVGVDPEGHPVVAAIRERIGFGGLGAVLDALISLRPALPALLTDALPPVRLETPRLVLAAGSVDALLPRVLRWLSLGTTFVELRLGAGRAPELVLGDAVQAAVPARSYRDERRSRGGHEEQGGSRDAARRDRRRRPDDLRDEERAERGRRQEGQGRGGEAAAEGAPARFEEVSLFDLDVAEEATGEEAGREGAGRRRRRRRGRGRGRSRGPGGDGDTAGREGLEAGDGEERAPRADRGDPQERGRERQREARGREREDREEPRAREGRNGIVGRGGSQRDDVSGEADDDDDLTDSLVPLSPDAPEFVEEPEVPYEEDGEEAEGESDPEAERMRRERELRRRARVAKAAPLVQHEAPRERPLRPKRVAILAHADRDSLAAAVVLARDLRLLEGIWVYPQAELMTFFRGVATDLREETPIHVIGFSASPARDVLQAAALYRGRLVWYDHHAWPPEDVERLRGAIGAEAVHVTPGVHSALPAVLARCGRRSRFSDKLVDLICARFSHHDYERWGRLWWTRLAAIAARPGERRADLEPLLVGRPSDLAREAAHAQAPAPPPEVAFVAGQDFRLVHFGGHGLVVVCVPPSLDLHLSARIARERYGVMLSLAWVEGEEIVVLAADEQPGRRALDVVGVIEHLASKHDWVEALSDADHVARLAVKRLALHPERIDELLVEIAMGRSILEG